MAYQLQPGLAIVQNVGARPSVKANEEVFVYPQPSTLNYCCRPNTMLYGTAPYMAGKGSPAQFDVRTSSVLNPLVLTRSLSPPMSVTFSLSQHGVQGTSSCDDLRTTSTRAELRTALSTKIR